MVDPLGGGIYWAPLVIALLVGYLIGSVPFGLLFTKFAGAGDVRQIGSGNIGATNVLRTGRKGLALATLLADLVKGWLPVWLAYQIFGADIAIAVGLGTVLGHCFPVWLKFKGGKGVATAAGVIFALTPAVLLFMAVIFGVIVWATRFVSLASVTGAGLAPIIAYLLGHIQAAELYVLLALIVIVMHRENIGRLIRGEENRLSFKKPS